jgi:hypothetical protein
MRRGRAVSTLHLPTSHLPGTAGKIKVLQQRAAAGLPLFHPFDATYSDRAGIRKVDDDVLRVLPVGWDGEDWHVLGD